MLEFIGHPVKNDDLPITAVPMVRLVNAALTSIALVRDVAGSVI